MFPNLFLDEKQKYLALCKGGLPRLRHVLFSDTAVFLYNTYIHCVHWEKILAKACHGSQLLAMVLTTSVDDLDIVLVKFCCCFTL